MSDRPFMNFWTGDYLKKTRHLTTLEHGAYLLLIMECWERPSGSLPDKPELLARLSGLTLKEWNEISPIVLDFFKLNKRKKEYTQERVTEERAKVALKRKAAQSSAATRWNKKKKPNANALPSQSKRNANHNQNQNHKEKKKNYIKEFAEFWNEYPSRGKHSNPKKDANVKFIVAAGKIEPAEIINAAKNYCNTVNGNDPKFTMQASTWLNKECWEQYAELPIEEVEPDIWDEINERAN